MIRRAAMILLLCPALLAAAPSVTVNDVAGLRAALVAPDAAQITLRPGTYPLDDTLILYERENLDLILDGVTLVRALNDHPGLQFVRCRNVTVRGLTLRCATIPFTQGIVEAVAEDGTSIDLRVDAGYPTGYLTDRATVGYAFDAATRRWKRGGDDYPTKSAAPIDAADPMRLRLMLEHPLVTVPHTVAAGDRMAFRGTGAHDVFLDECDHVTLRDLTIRGGTGFCVQESGGAGDNQYDRYTLTYPDRPAGASETPLISANADAFHSNATRHGPTLERCTLEGMCDDGIAIHGYYAYVLESHDNDLFVGFMWDNAFVRPGDPIRLFDEHGTLTAQAKATSVDRVDDFTPAVAPKDTNFGFTGHYFRVRTDAKLDAKPAYRISDPAACGNGFAIRDNTIRGHRARGMLIKASDGVIERNTIDGSTIAGLLIAPEYFWAEADYAHNVDVHENVFRHCGTAQTGTWNAHAGALTIAGEGDQVGGIELGHHDLTIERNAFEENDGCNLLIDGARGVRVVGNAFVRAMRVEDRRGADRGVESGALIVVKNARDIRFDGNAVREAGAAMKKLVSVSDSAVNVSNADGGVAK